MDFKKLKNLFVEPIEDTSKSSAKPTSPAAPATLKKQESKLHNIIEDTGIDDNILNLLLKSIEKNNLPGEDYIEFMEALKAMKNLNLDDKIKFQTVMATLSTKGLTKDKIIDSGNYYIKILESEFEKFTTTLASETKNQIENRETEITNIEKTNNAKSAEIHKLTVEINKNVEQISDIKKQIEEAKVKISNGQKRFLNTFDFLKNQIITNIEKIKTI